jgi:hypothetical protein
MAIMSAFAAGRMGIRGVALVVVVTITMFGFRVLVGMKFSEKAASRTGTATFWVATLGLLWYLSVFGA